MKIAIIGAGNVGQALGTNWASKGHTIIYAVRDPLHEKYQHLAAGPSVRLAFPAEAVELADVLVLCLPWPTVHEVLSGLGDLGGKVLIDCTNPLGMTDGGLALTTGFTESGGELVATWAENARVVKSLNQVGAEIMQSTDGFAHPPAMFMASDDDQAKQVVASLLADLGLEPMDAGALVQSRILEPLAMVWINQALLRGKGRDWAFTAQPRKR